MGQPHTQQHQLVSPLPRWGYQNERLQHDGKHVIHILECSAYALDTHNTTAPRPFPTHPVGTSTFDTRRSHEWLPPMHWVRFSLG